MSVTDNSDKAWFVDAADTVVTWSTAVVGGRATIDIYQVTAVSTRPVRQLWAKATTEVSAFRVQQAKSATASGAPPTDTSNRSVDSIAAAVANDEVPDGDDALLAAALTRARSSIVDGAPAESDTLAEISALLAAKAGTKDLFKALVRLPETLLFGALTRDTNGALTTGSVKWPDGATGTFNAVVKSPTFPGSVDAYTITHVLAGTPTLTYTQPTVTRDTTTGAVTVLPDVTVA